jgi:hypothetical protein
MKITLKATTKAIVKPTFIGFVRMLLGKPITVEIDLKDVPVVLNDEN